MTTEGIFHMNVAAAYKEKILAGNSTLIVGERQSGKTTRLLSEAINRCASNSKYKVLFISPFEHASMLASSIPLSQIYNIPDDILVTRRSNMIIFENGSEIKFACANASRGLKADLICIDEASYIANLREFLDDVMPMSRHRMASISVEDMSSAKGILLRSILEEVLEI